MIYGAKQQTRPYTSEAVSEIALDSLSSTDCLLIKTANSTYCFLVTDSERRRGILMGGALGSGSANTVLLGAEIRTNGQVSSLSSKLCEGARGIFFVASPNGVKELITSAITRLIHTRAKTIDDSESRACVSGDDRPLVDQL
jgi:hypothetical protein